MYAPPAVSLRLRCRLPARVGSWGIGNVEDWNILRVAHWRVPRSSPRFNFSSLKVSEHPVRAVGSVSPSEYDSCSGELK